jgi:uncharacterized protein with GYD domain
MNTYIIVCDFEQDDLTTVSAGGQELEDKAKALGETLDGVKVSHIYLTHGGNHDVVVILEAPSEDLAREMLALFDDVGEPEATLLTVTADVPDNIVAAFNGHTNM